jgi:peptidoglycan hydrolase-like protein with peptidoglycan-binding domain
VPVRVPAAAHPTLAGGSNGAAVAELQRRLNRWMTATHPPGLAPLEVDGIFGLHTTAAVRAFQQAQGLQVDGIVGRQTWQRLLTGPALPAP